jgi:3-methyladenine DNA glycosylase/8-oxoguanine DNA glycosylase
LGISPADLETSLRALAGIEPAFAAALERAGLPAPRTGERGYVTLLRAIIGQQVSVASANAIWNKLDAQTGGAADPANMARTSDEGLRAAGLSRQKMAYARSLSEEVLSGRLDLCQRVQALLEVRLRNPQNPFPVLRSDAAPSIGRGERLPILAFKDPYAQPDDRDP